MAAKHFLAKLLLGRDINEDLAMAEKGNREVHGKYNNACQTISVLEEKNRELSKSLDASKQDMISLQSEKNSIYVLLSQLLAEDEFSNAKTILAGRLDNKKVLLSNLIENLRSSQKEFDLILDQLKKLKVEKTSLEHDIENKTREIELLKEKSKHRDEQKAKREEFLSQRRGVRDNLLTLKNEWQETLDEFKARIDDADSLRSFKELKRELEDYARRVNNAIEISVK